MYFKKYYQCHHSIPAPARGRLKNVQNEFSVDVCGKVCANHHSNDVHKLHAKNTLGRTKIDDVIRHEIMMKKTFNHENSLNRDILYYRFWLQMEDLRSLMLSCNEV